VDTGGKVNVLRNVNGDGTVWEETLVDSPNNIIKAVATGDFDGDGYRDIVSGSSTKKLYLHKDTSYGWGTSWTTTMWDSLPSAVSAISVFDYDGDNYADIAYADEGGNVLLFLNADHQGTTWDPVTVAQLAPRAYNDITQGDVDGDGDLDIVTGDNKGDVYVHINPGGSGSWTSTLVAHYTKDIYAVDIGDLNGQNGIDIVAGGKNKQLYYISNGGGGSSWSSTTLATLGGNIRTLDVTDVDEDGQLDIVTGDEAKRVLFHRNLGGASSFQQSIIYQATGSVYAISVNAYDVDNDGDGDIISAGKDKKVHVHHYDSGSWTAEHIWTSNWHINDLDIV